MPEAVTTALPYVFKWCLLLKRDNKFDSPVTVITFNIIINNSLYCIVYSKLNLCHFLQETAGLAFCSMIPVLCSFVTHILKFRYFQLRVTKCDSATCNVSFQINMNCSNFKFMWPCIVTNCTFMWPCIVKNCTFMWPCIVTNCTFM
jgi:hypothetical protein